MRRTCIRNHSVTKNCSYGYLLILHLLTLRNWASYVMPQKRRFINTLSHPTLIFHRHESLVRDTNGKIKSREDSILETFFFSNIWNRCRPPEQAICFPSSRVFWLKAARKAVNSFYIKWNTLAVKRLPNRMVALRIRHIRIYQVYRGVCAERAFHSVPASSSSAKPHLKVFARLFHTRRRRKSRVHLTYTYFESINTTPAARLQIDFALFICRIVENFAYLRLSNVPRHPYRLSCKAIRYAKWIMDVNVSFPLYLFAVSFTLTSANSVDDEL